MDDTASVETRLTIPDRSSRVDLTLLTANVLEIKKDLTTVRKEIGEVRSSLKLLDVDVSNVFSYLQALEAKFVACGLLR
jgi:D-ribose pyranose/furanose isomerase RbsD